MARVRVIAVFVAIVAAASTAASGGNPAARFGEPASSSLLLGVVGPDPAGFDRLTGKHHALHVMFANWSGDVAGIVSNEHAAGRLPVLSLSSSVAPADIARGAEDSRYVTLARALNGVGENVWVTPFIDANGPAAYWPGPSYVDIVADDLYSDSAEPSWQGMDTLYAYAKPFLVAEWGLKGEDDTVFASRMFTWISSHPRLIGLVYFNKGWSGGSDIFELRSKPRSLAVYRRAIRQARFLAKLP